MGLGRAEKAELAKALASEDEYERGDAIVLLAEAEAPDALKDIESLESDPSTWVQGALVFARWRLGAGLTDVGPLVELLQSSDEEATQMAVHTLARMGADAVPFLEEHILRTPRGRNEALRVLCEMDCPDAAAAISRAEHSEVKTIARSARRALKRRRGKER